MKKLTMYLQLLIIFVMSNLVLAQNAPIDYEAGGYGADWTWVVFENDTNPALEIVSNPDASGVNTSSTVAKFTALVGGQPWAGTESLHGSDIGTFNLDDTNSTIKIMVYKPVLSDVGIKLVKPDGWSIGEIKVSNTVINEWEELTFDFSTQVTEGYDQIVIFPDFDLNGRTTDNICYFDNVSFHDNGGNPPVVPTVAATPPTVPSEGVVSMFSNVYTNVFMDTWSAAWDDAIIQDVQIAGDDVKLYTGLNVAGIEFISQTIDASTMDHFYMDFWTPDPTAAPAVFKVKLVDLGADGVYGGGDDTEHEVILDETILATESWVSLDMPLSDFTGLSERGHLGQLILSGNPNTVYLDNIYFYDSSYVGIFDDENVNLDFVLANNYPNPFNPSTSINFSMNKPGFVSLKVFDSKGQLVKTLVNEYKSENSYKLNWNATNDNELSVATGVYFYRLAVDNKIIDTKSMILMK